MSTFHTLQAKIDDIKLKISDQEYIGMVDDLKTLFLEQKTPTFKFAKVELLYPQLEVDLVKADIVMKTKSVYRMVYINNNAINRARCDRPGYLEIRWTENSLTSYDAVDLGVVQDVLGEKIDVGQLRNTEVLPRTIFVNKITFL